MEPLTPALSAIEGVLRSVPRLSAVSTKATLERNTNEREGKGVLTIESSITCLAIKKSM